MDAKECFEQKFNEEMGKVVKPTILVCGYTGCGKTSLIQAICGKDTVPDDRIGHGESKTKTFIPYRNAFINLWDSQGLEVGKDTKFVEDTKDLIARLKADRDPHNHVHLVWYTVLGPLARVTELETKLIREVFSNVIVVLTQKDLTSLQKRDAMTKVLVERGVSPARILSVSEKDPESLRAVVALSMKLLPEAYRDAFRSAQLVDLKSKKYQAQIAIHSAAALAAAAAGKNSILFTDASIITPIQFTMIAAMAVIYGLPAEGVKAAAAPIVAETAGVMAATSLSKLFPKYGKFIQAGVAAALTEAIGQLVDSWMNHCCEARIKGEPMPDFHIPTDILTQMLKAYKSGSPATLPNQPN